MDVVNAVETYVKVLNSVEDNKSNIRTDVTQQIHTLFHLSNILSELNENGVNFNCDFKPSELREKVEELSKTYLGKSKSIVENCKKSIDEVDAEISQIQKNFKLSRAGFPTSAWWCIVFENLKDNETDPFFEKLQDTFKNAPGRTILKRENSIIDR